MSLNKSLSLALLVALVAGLGHAQTARQPHIGYVFPAGGNRGTTFEVVLGGQLLRRPKAVHVSGEGVEAEVVKHYRPRRNLMPEQRKVLRETVQNLLEKRWSELPGTKGKTPPWGRRKPKKKAAKKDSKAEPAKMPEHPMLRDLEKKTLHELQHITNELILNKSFRKRQINNQLAEMVVVKVTVAPGAKLGDRELRMETASGLTNPMCFQVGALPEIDEMEPNNPDSRPKLPALPPAKLPVVINGQILPGDVDRIPFSAKAGQRLVVRVAARHLVPYLADAVPGWFQATVSLIGPRGEEVAFADDYQFDPDPVLFYTVPKDGVYELEIHDSIYRGRQDFVYRVAIGELPFVTHSFPLGAKTGQKVVASIGGEHLAAKRVALDTRRGDWGIRRASVGKGKNQSNDVLYVVEDLPEMTEKEPNDDRRGAQRIFLPRTLNGRIESPGDVDVYVFRGKKRQEVVAEVMARRLRSPLDSLLRLTDARGRTVAWNDDHVRKDPPFLHTGDGLLTHHADSYLRAELPKDGNYYLHVSDTSSLGGKAYGYRIRVALPQPDFALRVSPATLSLQGGRVAPITVHILRRDGFTGSVQLGLRDAPEGMLLAGGRIPAGQDKIRLTLTTPKSVPVSPFAVEVEGTARIRGKAVKRLARPVDDVMQAFLWRHLAPAEEMQVAMKNVKWNAPRAAVEGKSPVPIRVGTTSEVKIKTPPKTWVANVEIVLNDPPKGMSVGKTRTEKDGYVFELIADKEELEPGLAGNLIAEAFGTTIPKAPAKGKKGKGKKVAKAAAKPRRISLGYMPAIPFQVAKR